MGIRGLTTYCAQNEASTSTHCEELREVTLAVDFVGFLYDVCELLFSHVQQEEQHEAPTSAGLSPQAWLLLGGCPDRLESHLEKWLKTLREAKIALVFVTDPPQCFGGVDHRKGYCLQDRALQKADRIHQLADALFEETATAAADTSIPDDMTLQSGLLPVRVPATLEDRDEPLVPQLRLAQGNRERTAKLLQQTNGCFPFAREKLRAVLKKHGIAIKTAKREADEELADLVRAQQAFAVLGRDSDFLCMRGIRYIPFAKLNVNKSTGIISARVFTPELVSASLGLQVNQLVDLALLCSNDLTPLLDVEFNMAKKLSFPIQRVLNEGASSLFPKDAAKWIVRQLPVLENPVLMQIEAETPGFLRSLYEIYRFYGHSTAFLQRFPLKIEPLMPENKLNTYRKLLDQFEFPSSAIDVLETQARSLSNRFDPLLVKGKSISGLLAEVRHLAYYGLNVLTVREVDAGDRYDRIVVLKRLDFLNELHSIPHHSRSAKLVDRVLRDLVVHLLYRQQPKSGTSDVLSLCGSMGKHSKQDSDTKTIAYALLALTKYDASYLPECQLLTHWRTDILLLTSLLCINTKSQRAASSLKSSISTEIKEQAIEWSVFTAVTVYLETLKHLYQLRAILGEKQPATAGCATFFSSDVFIKVCDSLSGGRGVQAAWSGVSAGGAANDVLSKAQVDSVVQQFSDELVGTEKTFWSTFSQIRTALKLLKKLLPAPPPRAPVSGANGERNATTVDSLSTQLGHLQVNGDQSTTMKMGMKVEATTLTVNGKPPLSVVVPSPLSSSSKGKASSVVSAPSPSKKALKKAVKKAKAAQVAAQNGFSNGTSPAPPPPLPTRPPLPPPLPPMPPRTAQSPASSVKSSKSAKTKKAAKALKGLTPAVVAKRLGPNKQGNARNGSLALNPSSSEFVPQSDVLDSTAPAKRKIQGLQGLMETLPVFQHRHEILANVASNQITIIQGETGCGKSTSVPQFLLDDSLRGSPSERPVNIFVTQPRRIAAIELANTVAGMRQGNEFDEDGQVGKVIGYRIGQKQMVSSKTKITYVTTGYMVERLIHDPDALQKITHLVLDEVHERSMDVDLLLLLLRLQLSSNEHLRLVIMSATMDAKVIFKYFGNALATRLVKKKPLFVGSKLFPVEYVFLDDLSSRFPSLMTRCRKELAFMQSKFYDLSQARVRGNSEMAVKAVSAILERQLHIILELIKMLIASHQRQQQAQCILVFLPGIGSINAMFESLTLLAETTTSELVRVFVLHSGLELEHQQEAFRTIDERSTKIILSTNIAESSVTIPDVTHVINCGIEKQIEMPNAGSTHAEVLMDTWCSQASAKQRSGRAGRVMPGTAFHLFSQDFYEACMLEYSTPEMLRKPLDRIILLLKGKMDQFGTPSALLTKAMDAPDLQHIEGAYKLLAEFDAIDSANEVKAKMTPFGSFVCHLPLSLHLCRLVMTGMYLVHKPEPSNALPEATTVTTPVQANGKKVKEESWPLLLNVVILAAVLGVPDLFLAPSFYHAHSPTKYLKEMNANLRAKVDADAGTWSEPLGVWRMYLALLARHSPTRKVNLGAFCHSKSISMRRYQSLNFLISDLCNRLIASQKPSHNKNSSTEKDTGPKAVSFGSLLDARAVEMLRRLDAYASSQRVDFQLLTFAKSALSGTNKEEDVLRFLLVHNYHEHLIGGTLAKPASFKDDDLDGLDRIDLKVADESFGFFSKMKNRQRIEMFDQLASSSADPLKEFAAVAYDGKTVSLYAHVPKAKDSKEADKETQTESVSFEAQLPRMSFPVALLYYVRDQKFPVFFGVRSPPNPSDNEDQAVNEETKLRFNVGKSNGASLTWTQQKDNVKVTLGGRSLFSLPVRVATGDNKDRKLLAVYIERLFTGDETRMFCSKCTLLPPDAVAYYPTLLLVSARRGANIWAFVNEASSEIVTIQVDGQVATLPPKTGLKIEILDTVNTVRQALSDALNGASGGKRVNAADLLVLADGDRNFVVKATKGKKGGATAVGKFTWRQLRMEEPDKQALQEMEAQGLAVPRFPRLYLA